MVDRRVISDSPDAHARAIAEHLHPPAWTNPSPAPRYNLVVIGGGTAGLVAAAGAAGLGARVALVERHLLGGDCLNTGCVPSKTLIRAARAAADVRSAHRHGVHATLDAVDFASVMDRVRAVRVAIAPHDSAARFRSLGVDVFFGHARFTSHDLVDVDGAQLRFVRAIVATGGRPTIPDVPGLRDAAPLTSDTVFDLTAQPRRLAIVGGGPVGCELAQAFARLGTMVTLIEATSTLLPREEPEASALVRHALEADGVSVRAGVQVLDVRVEERERVLILAPHKGVPSVREAGPSVREREGAPSTRDGAPSAHEAPSSRRSVEGTPLGVPIDPDELRVDEILVAAGRAPNVDGLGLDAAGVAYDATRGVHVSDTLQTTNPRVYAAGDVCLDVKFTHAADASARAAIQNALFLGRKRATTLSIPWSTFTAPEVAGIGLSTEAARQRGVAVDVFERRLADVDRARIDDEVDGFVKVLVAAGTDRIVGAAIVAPHAGDLIAEIAVAMAGRVGLGRLASVIHPYPTLADGIRQLGDAYNRTRLTPRVKALFDRWLRWRR